MAKCPHCNDDIQIEDVVYRNVETYGQSSLARAECCGRGVYVSRKVIFGFHPYCGTRTEDDWGSDIKQKLSTPKTQADINEELAFSVLDKFIENKNGEALDIIRGITNPLTAAWVVQDVLESLSKPSTAQTKNWLINALYDGK